MEKEKALAYLDKAIFNSGVKWTPKVLKAWSVIKAERTPRKKTVIKKKASVILHRAHSYGITEEGCDIKFFPPRKIQGVF